MTGSCVQQLKRRLSALSAKFDFHKTFHRYFTKHKLLHKHLLEKSLNNSSADKEDRYSVSYLNYLTLINLDGSRNLQKAVEQNSKALSSEPRNFNALWNKTLLILTLTDEAQEDVRVTEIMDELHEAADDERTMIIAKAENSWHVPITRISVF